MKTKFWKYCLMHCLFNILYIHTLVFFNSKDECVLLLNEKNATRRVVVKDNFHTFFSVDRHFFKKPSEMKFEIWKNNRKVPKYTYKYIYFSMKLVIFFLKLRIYNKTYITLVHRFYSTLCSTAACHQKQYLTGMANLSGKYKGKNKTTTTVLTSTFSASTISFI